MLLFERRKHDKKEGGSYSVTLATNPYWRRSDSECIEVIIIIFFNFNGDKISPTNVQKSVTVFLKKSRIQASYIMSNK